MLKLLQLAELCYEECKAKRVHYTGVSKYLERKIRKEDKEIQQAIEIYVKYNLYDRNLTDKDFDCAKEILLNKELDKDLY